MPDPKHPMTPEQVTQHYADLAERLEHLAFELRGQSDAHVIDLMEAAQFIRDHGWKVAKQRESLSSVSVADAAQLLQDLSPNAAVSRTFRKCAFADCLNDWVVIRTDGQKNRYYVCKKHADALLP